jgi:hypothetical protein
MGVQMICEKCKKEFFEDWRKNKRYKKHSPCRFCSKSCSHSREQTDRMKNEKRNTYLEGLEKGIYNTTAKPRNIRQCKICNKEISVNSKSGCCMKHRPKRIFFNKKTRKRAKEEIIVMMGGSCNLCGYNKCIQALEFHHINPDNKSFTISSYKHSTEEMKEESKKCILLCANCHREIQYGVSFLGEYRNGKLEELQIPC